MKRVASFDEYDVYKYDNLNCYIHYKENGLLYTLIDDKMVLVSRYLQDKLLGEGRKDA